MNRTYTILKNFAFSLIISSLFLASCSKDGTEPDGPDNPPVTELSKEFNSATDKVVLRHEFRAAWLTTVGNYDWPPKNSTGEVQRAALISIIDRLKALNFNVILFHVRPTSDAFYKSQLVPWSIYLTGTQGQDPGFDPLQVAIDAAHERGMEVHAWLNPYRVGSTSVVLAANHPVVLHPEWCVEFNDNRYLNPGLPEVKAHLQSVIKEIIDNYDIDGIHFDDYFYPSGAKSTSNPFGFNDKAAFDQYGGTMDIHTWRKNNVDNMVKDVNQMIKTIKPKVVFGISPQGIQENSMTVYADALSWLQNKWVDYLAPQIYWQIGHPTADFNTVIRYWNSNSNGVPIIPGLAAYKYGDSNYPAYTLNEMLNEVNLGRSLSSVSGNCWFRVAYFLSNSLGTYIQNTIYPSPSLVPKLGTYNETVPGVPSVTLNQKTISWNTVHDAKQYVVYELARDGKTTSWNVLASQISTSMSFTGLSEKNYIVIAVNGREKSGYEKVIYIK
ncbi:MAG: family 10 glycosylhydrolase [Bacteroidales bacterium]